jgi:hypothetical protein
LWDKGLEQLLTALLPAPRCPLFAYRCKRQDVTGADHGTVKCLDRHATEFGLVDSWQIAGSVKRVAGSSVVAVFLFPANLFAIYGV